MDVTGDNNSGKGKIKAIVWAASLWREKKKTLRIAQGYVLGIMYKAGKKKRNKKKKVLSVFLGHLI